MTIAPNHLHTAAPVLLSLLDELSNKTSEELASITLTPGELPLCEGRLILPHGGIDPVGRSALFGKKMRHLDPNQAATLLDWILSSKREPLFPQKMAALLEAIGTGLLKKILETWKKRQFAPLGKKAEDYIELYRKPRITIFNGWCFSPKQSGELKTCYGLPSEMKNADSRDKLRRMDLLFEIRRNQGAEAELWAKHYFKMVNRSAHLQVYLLVRANQKEAQKQFLEEMKGLLIASSDESMLKQALLRAFTHCEEIEGYNKPLTADRAFTERYSIVLTPFPYTQQQIILFQEIRENISSDTFEMHKQHLLSIHDCLIKTLNTEQLRLSQLKNILDFSKTKSSKSRIKTLENFLKVYEPEMQEQSSSIASLLRTFNEPDHSQNDEKNINLESDLVRLYGTLEKILQFERTIRNKLYPVFDEALKVCTLFIDSYLIEQRVSDCALKLFRLSKKIFLPGECLSAINASHLDVLFYMKRQIQKVRGLASMRQLTVQHQRVAAEIFRTKQMLGIVEPIEEEESEQVKLAIKLIDIGATPHKLSCPPFRMNKRIDAKQCIEWEKYTQQLLNEGIRYEHIYSHKDWKQFVFYYIYERRWAKIAQKIEVLEISAIDPPRTFSEYFHIGKMLEQRNVVLGVVEGMQTKQKLTAWLHPQLFEALSDDALFHLFNFLSFNDLVSLANTNKRLCGLVLNHLKRYIDKGKLSQIIHIEQGGEWKRVKILKGNPTAFVAITLLEEGKKAAHETKIRLQNQKKLAQVLHLTPEEEEI